MNLNEKSRKAQVLAYLQARTGEWVDGPEIANERVGGSEGLKRLRELRNDDGYTILTRRHPDPARDVWQYQLVAGQVSPLRSPPVVPPTRPPEPRYQSQPRLVFGAASVCPRCHAKTKRLDGGYSDPFVHYEKCSRCGGFGVVP